MYVRMCISLHKSLGCSTCYGAGARVHECHIARSCPASIEASGLSSSARKALAYRAMELYVGVHA